MKTRNLILDIIAVAMFCMATLAGLTACTDNNDNPVSSTDLTDSLDPNGIVSDGASDIVEGRMVIPINVDSLDIYRLPVRAERAYEIETDGSEYFGAKVIEENGQRYAVPYAKKPMDKGLELVRVKVIPKDRPRLARNVIFACYKPSRNNLQTRAYDPLTSSYSEAIGKGTHAWTSPDATLQPILDYKRLMDENIGRQYVSVNSNSGRTLSLYKEAEDYQQMKESWAFNLGVSFKSPQHSHRLARELAGLKYDGEIVDLMAMDLQERIDFLKGSDPKDWIFKIRKKPCRAYSLSGSFNLGVKGNTSTSQDYEYAMHMVLVTMADIRVDLSPFEYNEIEDRLGRVHRTSVDTTFCTLLTAPFIRAIEQDPYVFALDVEKFYDKWGTDLITQGTFGGTMLYIYGRSQNCYESSVGVDASAKMRISWPTSLLPGEGNQWLNIFMLKNSPYVEASASGNWTKEEYHMAAKSVEGTFTLGGDRALSADEWIKGFDKSNDKWALISYRTKDDFDTMYTTDGGEVETGEVDHDYLYPIHMVLSNFAAAYAQLLEGEMTHADSVRLNAVLTNCETLDLTREKYMKQRTELMTPANRLVVADFLMMGHGDGRKTGKPESFVAEDPRIPGNYLIYYPMMANVFAAYDNGYTLDTSKQGYVNWLPNNGKWPHVWYYAMARESETTGITSVKVQESSPGTGWSKNDKCDNMHYGMGGLISDAKYVWVKWFDKERDAQDKKITAIGMLMSSDRSDSQWTVIANTAGSELRRDATQSELDTWKANWNSGYKNESELCYTGSIDKWHKLYPVFWTKTLPIVKMTEKNVSHPKKWGE